MSSSALSLTCALGGGGCLITESRGFDLESDLVIGMAEGMFKPVLSRVRGRVDMFDESPSFCAAMSGVAQDSISEVSRRSLELGATFVIAKAFD